MTALEELRQWRVQQEMKPETWAVTAPEPGPVTVPDGPPERPARRPLAISPVPASDFHRGASAVLGLIARAETPLSHTALVKTLQEDGFGKDAACAAVAEAQGRGWIEHDLRKGYVLSTEDSLGEDSSNQAEEAAQ